MVSWRSLIGEQQKLTSRNKIVYTLYRYDDHYSQRRTTSDQQVLPGQAPNESPSQVEQSFFEFFAYFRIGGAFVYRCVSVCLRRSKLMSTETDCRQPSKSTILVWK